MEKCRKLLVMLLVLTVCMSFMAGIASAEETVVQNSEENNQPEAAAVPITGDNSDVFIWAAIVLLSGCALLALTPRKRKQ